MATKNRTISANQLPDNTNFLISGRVTYSRIRSQVAGEELDRTNRRLQAAGRSVHTRPYTTLTICDAKVVRADPNAPMMAPEEIFATESLYTSSQPNSPGLCYSGYNTGSYLPRLCVRNGSNVTELDASQIAGELAAGLLVTMVMRVYNSGKQNKGISMDTIIVDEPIRFYQGGGMNLEKYGLTMNLQPNRQPAQPVQAPSGAPQMPAAYPQTGYAAPAAPAQPAAPVQAPAQPVQPPAAPYTPGMDTMPFGGAAAPNPYGAPVPPAGPYMPPVPPAPPATPAYGTDMMAPEAPAPGAPGIMYDPNAPERSY